MQTAKNRNVFRLQLVPDVVDTREVYTAEENAAKLVLSKLSQYVDGLNDDYLNIEAWSIFNAWLDSHYNSESEAISLFRSWQFFHWRPEPGAVKHSLFTTQTPTIASVFAKTHYEELSARELMILESSPQQRLDIYEIVAVQPGYLTLYGTIHRSKRVVYAPEISAKAKSGEYLLANILPLNDNHSIFIGQSPILPRPCKPFVDDFQSFVERCDLQREFRNFESDVFNLFYDLTRDFQMTR